MSAGEQFNWERLGYDEHIWNSWNSKGLWDAWTGGEENYVQYEDDVEGALIASALFPQSTST